MLNCIHTSKCSIKTLTFGRSTRNDAGASISTEWIRVFLPQDPTTHEVGDSLPSRNERNRHYLF